MLIRNVMHVTLVYRYVFFLDPCNIDIVQRKIKSMALCVSLCPTEEMKTYGDLRRFAMNNGESLSNRGSLTIHWTPTQAKQCRGCGQHGNSHSVSYNIASTETRHFPLCVCSEMKSKFRRA